MSDLDELGLTEEELKQLQDSDIPTETPSAEPTPEVKPEVTPEAVQQQEAKVEQMQQQKMVPLAALQEARAELRGMRQQLATLEAVKQEVLNVRQQLTPKPEVIKYEDDPFGAIRADMEALKQANIARDQMTMQILQQEARKQQEKQFADYIVQDEMSVRQQIPDYEAAFQHLVAIRTKELEALGIHDPQEIAAYLQQDALRATTQAIRSGQSPSAKIYELAQLYGYKPAPVTTPEQPQGQKPRDEKGRFAAVEAGQQAAKTLQGGVPTGNVTAEMLLDQDLPPEEFNRLWSELFPESKRTFL